MTNRSVQWVIGLGILAILAILAGQAYFFYQDFNLRERQTVQSFRISLQSVAESISQFNKSTLPDNIIHQYSPDYFIVDINNRIDPWVLEHYLRTELMRRHLDVDFEYAIYDCDDDRMVYGNYVSLDQTEEVKNKLEYWPKYEEGLYYFGVHFPGMRNYLLGEMGLWYFFTGILVMVILFFGYSMMIILRQKKLSEIQRDFINNMSHEFRTPLTSIGLASDVILEEGQEGDKARFSKYSAILKDQIIQLQKKVDKILVHAETENKFFRLNTQKLYPEDVVTEVLEELKPSVEHSNGVVRFTVQSGNQLINADRYHFSGILINLIDNSLKYTSKPPDVCITLSANPKRVFIKLEDKGTGIDSKYLRKVFMPFFRVPSGNIHNVKGTGLGLSYVKQVCDLHGWKVKIESAPGQGTTVTISIPKTE
ncbi:MAG TPA: HAMP domain-containing sensor histidine kinase [Bacteroidales bacterium]|nr:HAMP domain-containing sensor histidine kinase [Bacteroidales bacterium]HPM92503.1 HAMP domain-containing sensor histidine kinase [Bacteroidales bacterium]